MNFAALIVVGLVVVVLAAVVLGRPLTIAVKGIHDIKATVGEKNGNGTLATMQARTLGELAEVRSEQAEVKAQLEARTHIIRDGSTEPEDLGAYTQDRMHDVLTAIGVVSLKVDTVWRFLQDHGYDLPDLSSMTEKEEP